MYVCAWGSLGGLHLLGYYAAEGESGRLAGTWPKPASRLSERQELTPEQDLTLHLPRGLFPHLLAQTNLKAECPMPSPSLVEEQLEAVFPGLLPRAWPSE